MESTTSTRTRPTLRIPSLGLGIRLTLTAGFLLVATGGALTFVFYRQGNDLLSEELHERGRSLAATLARECRYGVLVGDRKSLHERVDGAVKGKDIVYVAIVSGGKVMVSARNGEGQEFHQLEAAGLAGNADGLLYRGAETGEFYDFEAPIMTEVETEAPSADDLLLGEESNTPADTTSKKLGAVHIGLTSRGNQASLWRVLRQSMAAWGGVSLVGLLILWLVIRRILMPLRKMTEVAVAVADGDLSHDVAVRSRDEVGRLAHAFRRMGGSLRTMIEKVAEAAGSIDSVSSGISEDAGQIAKGSALQLGRTEETSASILEMDESVREVAGSAEGMVEQLVGTIASVEEMTQSIGQINENVKALQAASEDVSASILEMNANINEVGESEAELSALVDEAANSIEQILGSIADVEKNMQTLAAAAKTTRQTIAKSTEQAGSVERQAAATRIIVDRVAKSSARGKRAVSRVTEGMDKIQVVFRQSATHIESLGVRSRQIGEIVTLIDEIAERTNLLALNAAIIAAKAGSRGRGFAVVAEEIRELSARTSRATRDISHLVSSVREDVEAAVTSSGEGGEAVLRGVELARDADDALTEIGQGAEEARLQAQDIEQGTALQLAHGDSIAEAMERTESLILEIFNAIEMQSLESQEIRKAMENMRDKAVMVKQATEEQRTGGSQITSAVERVSEMVRQISRATSEQSKNSSHIMEASNSIKRLTEGVRRSTSEQTHGSRQVVEAVEQIHTITQENAKRAQELNRSVAILLQESAALRSHIGAFRR